MGDGLSQVQRLIDPEARQLDANVLPLTHAALGVARVGKRGGSTASPYALDVSSVPPCSCARAAGGAVGSGGSRLCAFTNS